MLGKNMLEEVYLGNVGTLLSKGTKSHLLQLTLSKGTGNSLAYFHKSVLWKSEEPLGFGELPMRRDLFFLDVDIS